MGVELGESGSATYIEVHLRAPPHGQQNFSEKWILVQGNWQGRPLIGPL